MSLTPSIHLKSRERKGGQLGELRAETADQEHPETIRSFRPGGEEIKKKIPPLVPSLLLAFLARREM